jgi:hypothetical protein
MTIGYNRLGSNGRLGNQMFQYAGLRGIAIHKGYDWVIPPFYGYGDSNYGLFDCFKMSSVKEENFGHVQGKSIQSGCFHFSQEFFDNCPDNINLHDYFTTEKYFKNIEDLIRNDFEFNDKILNPCKEIFVDLKNPIFLHVRRSDYIGSQAHHPLCSLQYYENALKHFDESSPVLVFSDDIEWCRGQELFSSDRFMLSEYQEKYPQKSDTNDGKQNALIPYFDLCMMTLCTGGIIANSTLSWWGAWLIENPTQPIIAPDHWFGPGYNHYIMEDLLPKNWIKVES